MELSKKQFITSLVLKSILIISVIIGVIVSATSESEFMSGNMIFMYFTIQSNILIAIVCLIGLIFLLKNFKANRIWYVIKLVSTISITLTGLVFTFMLAPTLGYQAWNLANILTHVIVPVSAVFDFFVVGISMIFKKKDVIYVIIPPLLYAIYAGIGYKLDWKFTTEYNYPYFFLNWGSKAGAFGFCSELPYIGVMYWIILLLLLLIGLGFLYLKIINVFKKKYNKEA